MTLALLEGMAPFTTVRGTACRVPLTATALWSRQTIQRMTVRLENAWGDR